MENQSLHNAKEIPKNNFELYSQRAISIATYFGGPLAAGILARQNFINLGKKDLGHWALLIGIISTLLLFAAVFSIPEEFMDKVPNAVIPFIYTGIIYLVIEKVQGSAIKEHKENKRPFYSAWKATIIGAGSMIVLFGGIFGLAYFVPDNFDAAKYDEGIATFTKNEETALQLFSLIDKGSGDEVLSHIDNVGIPAWKENIKLLDELTAMENIYSDLKIQNEKLKKYSLLRIDSFNLIKLAVQEDTDKYNSQIDELNKQINEILK